MDEGRNKRLLDGEIAPRGRKDDKNDASDDSTPTVYGPRNPRQTRETLTMTYND